MTADRVKGGGAGRHAPSTPPPGEGPAGDPLARADLDIEKPVARRRRRSPGRSKDVPEGARLLATQMAVSGSSRAEIEKRLRDELGVKDSSAILERIGV